MRKQVAVLISLSMLGALAIGARADAEEMRVRKNIDALTAEELSNYLHALDIVMRRDPTTVGSYAYYAALHNDVAVGPCEHASDTFLPWHRAHLFEFETELRLSDPPRTSNVTIPYWNWAELPSGSRFPLAFETEALIKRDDRNTTPICKGAPDPSCQRLPFPWADLDADVLSVSSWSSPAGTSEASAKTKQSNAPTGWMADSGSWKIRRTIPCTVTSVVPWGAHRRRPRIRSTGRSTPTSTFSGGTGSSDRATPSTLA